MTGRWFSPSTPFSSTNKTDLHDRTDILLKVASKTINQPNPVLAVDNRHVAFCEYNGSVARIICVAVATLANEQLLERASDNDLLLCRKSSRIKRVIDNDLIDV